MVEEITECASASSFHRNQIPRPLRPAIQSLDRPYQRSIHLIINRPYPSILPSQVGALDIVPSSTSIAQLPLPKSPTETILRSNSLHASPSIISPGRYRIIHKSPCNNVVPSLHSPQITDRFPTYVIPAPTSSAKCTTLTQTSRQAATRPRGEGYADSLGKTAFSKGERPSPCRRT